jgi:Putative zinc-finger
MIHPEGSLADYVDGTLHPHDRAAVDTHIAGCDRCRGEVGLARGALAALEALPEVPAPPGIATRALEEAGAGRAARSADGTPRWYRSAGIAAAAAAALFVLTLVLPHIGQDTSNSVAEKRTGAGSGGLVSGPVAATATQIEIQHTNYDSASVEALATSYAAQDAGAQVNASTVPSATGSQRQTSRALRCVVRSAPDESGQLARVIKARFEGAPAYLAVFLEGPGAGQPADAVSIWVFSADDCSILSYSSARL